MDGLNEGFKYIFFSRDLLLSADFQTSAYVGVGAKCRWVSRQMEPFSLLNLFHRHKRLFARAKKNLAGWRLSISRAPLCVMSKPYVEHLRTIIQHTILRARKRRGIKYKIKSRAPRLLNEMKFKSLHLEWGNDLNAAALGWLQQKSGLEIGLRTPPH